MTTGAGSVYYYGPIQANVPPTNNATNIPAPAVNSPLIFEPTAALLASESLPQAPELGVAVSAGPGGIFSSVWGGCNIFVSVDDVTYDYLGRAVGPSRMGILTATMASFGGTNPDTSATVSVSTAESNAELETVTSDDAANFRSICIVCDPDYTNVEYFSYETATLTSTNQYNLTTLYRGLYGTTATAHGAGSLFARLDASTVGLPLPPPYVGTLLYVKLQSFNIYSQGLQDLADCTAYTYTPTGVGSFGFVGEINTTGGISGGPISDQGTIYLTPIATGDLLANTSGSLASPSAHTASGFLDAAFGSVQGTLIRRNASVWMSEAAPLPYATFMPTIPGPSAIIRLMTTEASGFAANFSGSSGLAKAASTGTVVTKINVIHSGATTQIGSVTFPASASPTFATTGGTVQSAAAGDCLEFVYPSSSDATLADVAITLRATRS